MIHVLCVATENKGYLEFLEASCRRYDLELIKLKWGEQWKGYMDKIQSVIDYLKTLPNDDDVLFLDAYDTLLVRDPKEIGNNFPKDKIIVAVENVSGLSYSASASRFGTIDSELVNSGTYYGSVELLRKAFDIMEKMLPEYSDDQLLFTDLIRQNRSLFELDTGRGLAAVCADAEMRSAVVLTPEDGTVHFKYHNIDSMPFVLHYTYDGDMIPTLKLLGYDLENLKHRRRDYYHIKLFLHHAKAVMRSEWLLVVLCLLFVLLCVCLMLFFQLQKKTHAPPRHVHWNNSWGGGDEGD